MVPLYLLEYDDVGETSTRNRRWPVVLTCWGGDNNKTLNCNPRPLFPDEPSDSKQTLLGLFTSAQRLSQPVMFVDCTYGARKYVSSHAHTGTPLWYLKVDVCFLHGKVKKVRGVMESLKVLQLKYIFLCKNKKRTDSTYLLKS